MQLTVRTYQTEDDYWRIRAFLRKVLLLNDRREVSWHVARFDYWRWHGVENLGQGPLGKTVFIWETPEGQIAAVLNQEGRAQVFLQIHPDFRTPELEQEMITVAEQHLTTTDNNGKLWVWTDSQDNMRQAILTRRGFHKVDWADQHEYQRRRSLDAPILEAPPALGYTVRSLGDGLELLERCYASGLAFHEGDIKTAVENRQDPSWYRNIQNAPLYRRDLDLVAIAPDGAVASFCTIWFDDVTRTAYFEPVATAPAHQRRGLGKAVMCEGLRRLKRMGAIRAFVGSYEPPAHALYASVGFTEYDLSESWVKE